MSETEKMTPVTLYVPMTSWREVEGHLTTDPQGDLLLVIEGRARTLVDKYDGHDLSLLPLKTASDEHEDVALTDLWTTACRDRGLARQQAREKAEGTPFPAPKEATQ